MYMVVDSFKLAVLHSTAASKSAIQRL